ncbi:MAG: 3-phosphoshikimate 1-carboxyvinyltransferase, partial [Bacteroidota bacterium]
TAYLAVTGQNKVLTGTKRMCERPIKILVEALQKLGASIAYQEKEGYPPLQINGFKRQIKDRIRIRGDVSSQYISALLMIAPLLEHGLTLELTGSIGSRPYINMTLRVMEFFGIKANWNGSIIMVPPGSYVAKEYQVEPDWSAASYWYSIASLTDHTDLLLSDLTKTSIQGDRVIADIMKELGVSTTFTSAGAELTKIASKASVNIDFKDCPDLAQTVAVICAAKGIEGDFTGLESLKIKETDRIAALQKELRKINAQLIERNDHWSLLPGLLPSGTYSFHSYDDHRMAMAFAPLATLNKVEIDNPGVVKKSYPGYWKDYERAGFSLAEI